MSTDPLHAYYDAWQHGAEHYDAAALGELLATDLDFEGPLAGHRVGARTAWPAHGANAMRSR